MFRSTETMPVPSRGSSTVVLSTSNSRSDPSLGSTSSSSRASDGASTTVRDSAAENSMLFSSTARRRPSLSSSVAANSFSARELATISRPSVSVSMIGSVTELMMVKNSARSRRSFRRLFGQAAAAADLIELLPQHRRQPVHLAGDRRARLQQQQADGVPVLMRDRRASGTARTGDPPNPGCRAMPVVAAAAQRHRRRRRQRAHQRICACATAPPNTLRRRR